MLQERDGDLGEEFFVDSGLAYDGSAITDVSGLDHLEGKSVTVLADGVEVGPHTVSAGTITLDTAASQIVAGLPYTTTVTTLEPDAGGPNGTTYGQYKDVHSVTAHFVNTGAGVQIGLDDDHLEEVTALTEGELDTLSATVSVDGGDGTAAITIKTSSPLPMYLAAIAYDSNPGDE